MDLVAKLLINYNEAFKIFIFNGIYTVIVPQ